MHGALALDHQDHLEVIQTHNARTMGAVLQTRLLVSAAQTHARHRPVWFVLRRTVTHAQKLMTVVVLLQPQVEVIQLHNAGTKEVILQTRLLAGAAQTHARRRPG